MVKTGTVVAVGILGLAAFIIYYLFGGGDVGGGTGGAGPTTRFGSETSSPAGYSTASGQGSLAVTQIYAPQTSLEYSFSPTYKTQTINQPPVTQIGLININDILRKLGFGAQ